MPEPSIKHRGLFHRIPGHRRPLPGRRRFQCCPHRPFPSRRRFQHRPRRQTIPRHFSRIRSPFPRIRSPFPRLRRSHLHRPFPRLRRILRILRRRSPRRRSPRPIIRRLRIVPRHRLHIPRERKRIPCIRIAFASQRNRFPRRRDTFFQVVFHCRFLILFRDSPKGIFPLRHGAQAGAVLTVVKMLLRQGFRKNINPRSDRPGPYSTPGRP